MAHDYDLIVIGGGSGGVRAARVAAEHGARVAIAEKDRFGGTCVIRGCIPKKLFVYASSFAHAFEDCAAYGWTVDEPRFDWRTLLEHKDREIERLSRLYADNLTRRGVEILRGRARLEDRHTVEVANRRLTSRYVLIATGSHPVKPIDVPGVEHSITSDEAFHLEALPKRIAIAGGGYIAVEFAGIFRGLGCEVILVHRRDRVLRGFDGDVRDAVTAGLRGLGVELHLDEVIERIERGPGGRLSLHLRSGQRLEVDELMCATGRAPRTAGLGLEELGVELDERGAVAVDDYSRTAVDSVYAVGDCTDRLNLTPVAIREGHAFADTVFGDHPTPADHRHVPSAVFCQPPAAVVGLTEEQARAEGRPLRIYRSRFRPLFHTLTGREERVLMKVIADDESDRILGVHLVGKDTPEIIQTMAVAVRIGATMADLNATTAVHPSTAEELVLLRTPDR